MLEKFSTVSGVPPELTQDQAREPGLSAKHTKNSQSLLGELQDPSENLHESSLVPFPRATKNRSSLQKPNSPFFNLAEGLFMRQMAFHSQTSKVPDHYSYFAIAVLTKTNFDLSSLKSSPFVFA
ncbi:hypothetical protein AVEN_215781-1 [Araneus ventricosus]|uniref:Uncharacterized protein n=1 Tax=Araneus ventricosus TaxID=182803 RepID=A0A4Y2THN3_ARAVE|nr:hypothetical protein AVEN_215781-1 [Araneus ventricosus]